MTNTLPHTTQWSRRLKYYCACHFSEDGAYSLPVEHAPHPVHPDRLISDPIFPLPIAQVDDIGE